jgi:bifunctional non-homologous end joining protein LigD
MSNSRTSTAATMEVVPSMKFGTRLLAFSNLDKLLYPSGFTKREVIQYYLQIAPAILPHLKDRAVTLKRYPNGSNAPFFFEKNCPAHRPDWVKTAEIRGSSDSVTKHCVLGDLASLLWAANLAALELHVPLGKAAHADRPTAMVYDLDPGPPATLADCIKLGLQLRDVLSQLGLESCAKISGSKGLHVYVPLNTPAVTFDQTKQFAQAIAKLLERQDPGRVTTTMSKAQRSGKVFVDWSQNDRHKTTACAYTLRATSEPRVSTPVAWTELEETSRAGNMDWLVFSPAQVIERFREHGDLFLPVLRSKQRLPQVE